MTYLDEIEIFGDMGTGSAPSVADSPRSFFNLSLSPGMLTPPSVAQTDAEKYAVDYLKSQQSQGKAPVKPPPGTPAPGGPPGPNWWTQPLWPRAPIKRWQAGLGLLGGVTFAVGLVILARR